MNKYIYGYALYVNYGQGWEYEVFEETWKEIKQRQREYNENCNYPTKIGKRREPNTDYKGE